MSLKEAFLQHRYLFRKMETVRPSFCLFVVIVAVSGSLANFVSNVLLLRYALNSVQQQRPFWQAVLAFGLWLVIDLFIKSMRYAYQVWRIPLMAHDMHHHFSQFHFKNITIKHLIEEVTGSYESLIRESITCVANGILLALMDPMLLLFALIPLLALPLHTAQRRLRERLDGESARLEADLQASHYSWQDYYTCAHDLLRLVKRDGFRLAAIGYVIALLTEIVLEVGGMLYAVYQTVHGHLGYGDCLIAVTAVGSLSHTLLHLPELPAFIRRHGEDAAHFRAVVEGGGSA